MGYYRCILEVFQGYLRITLIAYKIYIKILRSYRTAIPLVYIL